MVAAHLGIPASQSTVSVKAINAGEVFAPAGVFFTPVLPEFPNLQALPCYCFLIEHAATGEKSNNR